MKTQKMNCEILKMTFKNTSAAYDDHDDVARR